MNMAVFGATALITKQPVKITRLVSGSVLGAIYACLLFGTDWKLLGFFITKLLFGAIVTATVFKPSGLRSLIKKTALFHLVTVIYGLLIMGVLYFTDIGLTIGGAVKNGVFYFNIPLWFVLLATLAAPPAAYILQNKLSRTPVRDCFILSIEHRGKKVTLTALADTGNFMKDPYNGNDVIIAEATSVLPLFEEISLPRSGDLPLGFKLIPYSSVGNSSSLLPGFVPDRISADGHLLIRATVAIFDGKLCQTGDYNAISKPISYIKKGHNLCSKKSLSS